MPPPRTFNGPKTSTGALRSHLVFTLGRLRRHSLTQPYIPTFQALVAGVDAVEAQARVLADEVDEAQVDIYVADDGLNEYATKVWKAVDSITKDPNAPIRKVLFAGKTLSDFSRPILGNQYTVMTQWPTVLAASEYKILQDLAPEGELLLKAGEAAIARKAAADTARRLFREVGERAKLFDDANAARKKLYGELSTLPHKHPGLPSSFAEKFFRRDVVENEVPEDATEPTVESVTLEIDRLTKLLAAQQAVLKALEEKAKVAAAEAMERQAAEARLQQLEQEEAERAKEKQALLAKLGKK